jgi:hypothetical protein
LGLDEHGYSSSVIECIVTATARFSSFRDATDAVQMAGIGISESQVRRLAHAVGAELIDERDRKVISLGVGDAELFEKQSEADGVPALPPRGFADDEQFGGIVGR